MIVPMNPNGSRRHDVIMYRCHIHDVVRLVELCGMKIYLNVKLHDANMSGCCWSLKAHITRRQDLYVDDFG